MNERIETNNPEATEALGEKLGREARAGQIYCLSGDLGVGKTVFTKGFAKGLGITEHVTSPTFAIVNEYEGRLPLYHFDVYRISCEEEMEDTGYEEYFYGGRLSGRMGGAGEGANSCRCRLDYDREGLHQG